MSCLTSILVNNSQGKAYALSFADDGKILADFVSDSRSPDFGLYNNQSRRYFKLVIDVNNFLTAVEVPASQGLSFYFQIILRSPSGYQFVLRISGDGQIQAFGGAVPAVAQIGQLFPPNDEYPASKQPGGIGTPVTDPVQTSGEMLGMWVAGCNHWFNHWMIESINLNNCDPSALVCCPLCGYVQRIITPYSLIHSDDNFIIFA